MIGPNSKAVRKIFFAWWSENVLVSPYLAHAVVGELDVSLVVQQHVVELEVAVDDAALVQEVQRQRDLGRVEARVLLRQPPLPLHVEPAGIRVYCLMRLHGIGVK